MSRELGTLTFFGLCRADLGLTVAALLGAALLFAPAIGAKAQPYPPATPFTN